MAAGHARLSIPPAAAVAVTYCAGGGGAQKADPGPDPLTSGRGAGVRRARATTLCSGDSVGRDCRSEERVLCSEFEWLRLQFGGLMSGRVAKLSMSAVFVQGSALKSVG